MGVLSSLVGVLVGVALVQGSAHQFFEVLGVGVGVVHPPAGAGDGTGRGEDAGVELLLGHGGVFAFGEVGVGVDDEVVAEDRGPRELLVAAFELGQLQLLSPGTDRSGRS